VVCVLTPRAVGQSHTRKVCRRRMSTWNATKPLTEPLLNSIIGGLLNEGRIRPGSVVDAGAFDGTWALWLAARCRECNVHAIDPLARNVKAIESRAPANLKILHAALGPRSTTLYLDRRAQKRAAASGYLPGTIGGEDQQHNKAHALPVVVRSLDDLYAKDWQRERLTLLHLDVEGAETDVLRGTKETLSRHMPIVIAEVHVHMQPARTQALIRFLASHRYEVFLVEEICGMRADCRNLLCIHRGVRQSFRGSDVLDMAIASRSLYAVDTTSIKHHAFPCCVRGGECCPAGRGPKRLWPGCCSHAHVHRWLSRQIATGGQDVSWFTKTRWFDHEHFVYMQHSRLHAVHLSELRKAGNDSGLSKVWS
jgi:FkbM family methyltransferase